MALATGDTKQETITKKTQCVWPSHFPSLFCNMQLALFTLIVSAFVSSGYFQLNYDDNIWVHSYYPFRIVLPLGRFAVNKWNGTCHLTTGKNGYIYFLQISTYTVEIAALKVIITPEWGGHILYAHKPAYLYASQGSVLVGLHYSVVCLHVCQAHQKILPPFCFQNLIDVIITFKKTK